MKLTRRTLLTVSGLLAGCRETGELAAPHRGTETREAAATRDVRYVPGSTHLKHRLDVYPPIRGPAPYVHFVHGGYWVSGDKDGGGHGAGLYASIGRALAARGIGCVIQSYRLAPEVSLEGMVSDVRAAVAWSVAHVAAHGGDASRLFLMGHSAGGHLAALLAADPARRPPGVRGYIPLSAIWDVADMRSMHDDDFNDGVTYPVFGRDEGAYAGQSPMSFLAADTPPLLIAIGSDDFPYMVPQAERAFAKLSAEGNGAAIVHVSGNDHMDMVRRFGAADDNMTEIVHRFVFA